MLKINAFHRIYVFFSDDIENQMYLSNPQRNQINNQDLPKSIINLTLMNFATNLPEQPTFNDSKFKQTMRENLKFIRGLFYLTKKIFML